MGSERQQAWKLCAWEGTEETQGKIRQAAGEPLTGNEDPSRRASCFRFSRNQVQVREPMTGAQSNGAPSFWSPRTRAACLVGSERTGNPSSVRGAGLGPLYICELVGQSLKRAKRLLSTPYDLCLAGPRHTALSQTQRVSECG